ncbi:uncharacterized protein LOC106164693 isoform X1 [Lingula anatina]|uniref:Uncharacterized protein LOC106164693 isoform X1 n=2 Tax=Lingula anatina TaxID=7574 RepID=A0A1S3IJR8_LINAN|nr:uncharacterized protein LOC106164693 isoform X1 [Lingula anatina]|eukprot:XP_013398131.1 uncharacterized protein LOC106164693 isoform X1 [Lingula anatina]
MQLAFGKYGLYFIPSKGMHRIANLILTTLFLVLLLSKGTGSVDCRKIIFHPSCRGIYAKRDYSISDNSHLENTLGSYANLYRQLGRRLPVWKTGDEEEEGERGMEMELETDPADDMMDNRPHAKDRRQVDVYYLPIYKVIMRRR